MSQTAIKRSMCSHCRYPMKQCVCHLVQKVTGSTKVWVLQDKLEIKHAKNSARLFALCYDNTRLVDFSNIDQVDELFSTIDPASTLLLYPTEDSLNLEDLTSHESMMIEHLVLLDGTWPKAKKMLLVEKRLADLRCVKFSKAPASNYDIRKSPNAQALSTLEAGVYALECLGNLQISKIRHFFSDVLELQWSMQPQEHKHRS